MIKEKPVEGHRWKTVVCSTDEARDYFKEQGLTYADITEGDILVLVMMLNKEIKLSNKTGETSVSSMCLSKKMILKKKSTGSIECCYLYMNSHYFTQREAISFNLDGFIGFAGWADQGNTNPLLRAFLKWCDYLAESKTKDENTGYVCILCRERYTATDIKELHDMGEEYYCDDDNGCFFCPDCWDKYQQMPVEQQIDILMNDEGTE